MNLRDVRALWVRLMPNHVHLALWPRGGALRVAAVLAAIKSPVSRRAIAWVTREAPACPSKMLAAQPNGTRVQRFWQRGGGYDRAA